MAGNTSAKRPLTFLGVGIVNTLLDFGFYTFLTSVVLVDRIALAGLISGSFALVCAFLTHGLITWRGSHIDHKTLLKFFLFTGFGMWIIRPLLLLIFINFSPLYEWAYDLSKALGLPFSQNFIANTGTFGLMLVILLTYNFFVYDRYVFRSRIVRENHSRS